MRRAAAIVILVGCGRIDFDPLGAPDSAPSCAHTFCDNFDRVTPPVATWTSDDQSGGTLEIDSSASVSAPSSLRVDAPLGGGPMGTGTVFLVEDLPGVATRSIHLDYQVAIAHEDSGAEVDLVQLQWLPAPAPCTDFGYYLVHDDTGPVELQETFGGCGAGNSNDTFPFGIGDGFHRVVLDIQLGAQAATRLQVEIDGVGVIDKTADRDLPGGALRLRMGAGTRTPSIDWIVSYDDVFADLE